MAEMEKLVEREVYTTQLKGFIDKPLIKVITGVRRCGKSGILNLIKQEIMKTVDEDHIIFISFEDSDFDNIVSYKDLNQYIKEKMKDDKRYYIFLDEIQEVTGWEKAVNSLRLKNTDIYITGSNSKLLSGELATLLAGRYVSFEARTLSFKEFINFRKEFGLDEGIQYGRYGLLDEYIRSGGFPLLSSIRFTDEQARRVISDIQSAVVLKDVIERNKIKNAPLLEKIVSFLYDNVGFFISDRKIADYIKSGGGGVDYETISSYIGHLEKALLIKRVSKYDVKGKRLLDSNDKYYLADHSLQYAVRDMKTTNRSGVLENIVHNDLVRRGYKVYVGKMGTKEIDFVAEKINGGEKVYVQVCAELKSAETIEREFSPLEDIQDHYPKYVVTTDTFWNEDRNGVRGIHLHDFLLREKL
ncbi:MAG: ATP-binding protein [Candidatus Methanoplasma sp.]|nr:ATP-binding protein [Candidatus Methanoplasma sp.]